MSSRCTFAHVDLGALQSNFRAISKFLANNAGSPTPRHHRRRQGQRVRPWRAGRRARAAGGGREDPRVRRHRRGGRASEGRRHHRDSDLRRARRERRRRRVRAQPDADHLDARRRAVAAGRGGEAWRAPSLSSEDRHWYEPARAAARQPRVHAARTDRQPQSGDRRRLHALRDGGRAGFSAVSNAARAIRARARALAAAGRRLHVSGTRPTARRRFEIHACGTTSFGRGS